MSPENVDVVRREYERISTDYKTEHEGEREAFHPDYEFDARDVAAGMGIIRGWDATEDALHEYWDMFEAFHIELKEVLHADEDRVVTPSATAGG